MRIAITSLLVLWTFLLAASCQPATVDVDLPPEQAPSKTEDSIATIAPPTRMNMPVTALPEQVPATETLSGVTGEVPDELLNWIVADLAERTGVPSDRILISRAEATVWSDGSLGCPQPGVFYTQALVNGFWVILDTGGKQYDYRAAESGYFFICENGLLPVSPPGTPGS